MEEECLVVPTERDDDEITPRLDTLTFRKNLLTLETEGDKLITQEENLFTQPDNLFTQPNDEEEEKFSTERDIAKKSDSGASPLRFSLPKMNKLKLFDITKQATEVSTDRQLISLGNESPGYKENAKSDNASPLGSESISKLSKRGLTIGTRTSQLSRGDTIRAIPVTPGGLTKSKKY